MKHQAVEEGEPGKELQATSKNSEEEIFVLNGLNMDMLTLFAILVPHPACYRQPVTPGDEARAGNYCVRESAYES